MLKPEIYTLDDAKKYLRNNFEDGCKCPACGQMVKLYKRKITSSMAYGLIILSKKTSVGEYIHLLNFFKNIDYVPAGIVGDLPKLRWWGLIKESDEPKEDGNPNNGYYSLTSNGKLFVDDMISVSKYVYLYNNKVQSRSDEQVKIKEALKDKFDYSEIMGLK